jgi:hypothetical protein
MLLERASAARSTVRNYVYEGSNPTRDRDEPIIHGEVRGGFMLRFCVLSVQPERERQNVGTNSASFFHPVQRAAGHAQDARGACDER